MRRLSFFIIILLTCQLSYAKICVVENYRYSPNDNTIVYDIERYQYEIFNKKDEAVKFAKEHQCEENIFKVDDKYYVFLEMPKDVLVCSSITKE